MKFNASKTFFIGLFALGLGLGNLCAQDKSLDSLKEILQKPNLADTERVQLLNRIAGSYLSTKIQDCKSYAEESLVLSERNNFRPGLEKSNYILALAYLVERPDPISIQYLAKAQNYNTHPKNNSDEIDILNYFGKYYIQTKEYEQAYGYLDEASNLLKDTPYKEGEARNLGLYLEISLDQKDLKKADNYLKKAEMASLKLRDSSQFFEVRNLMSLILSQKKEFNDAYAVLVKSLNFFRRTHHTLNEYATENLIGNLFTEEKNYELAHDHFMQCVVLSKKLGSSSLLSQTFNRLSTLDSLKGDYKQALEHYSDFMRLKDSLVRSEKDRQAFIFEARFANEKKNKENQVLLLEQSKNQVIIQQQLIGLFILFLALVGLIIILVKLQALNRQNKASLEEVLVKNQEIVFKNQIIEEQRLRQEKINLVKDKLFSVISHDMRTPLTQLQGILSLMEENAMQMSEWTDLLPALKRNVQSSSEQLDTLLIWSKNQMQGFQTHISQFPIYNLAEKNHNLLRVSLEEKQINFSNSIDPELRIEADQEMIHIVIRNLLSNAIKFTPNGGHIYLSSSESDGMAQIRVMDTGVGIKEEDYEKIFEEIDFSTAGTLGEKGTGLGLKLCRDFLVMNRGDIKVESVFGKGSSFIFTIPIAPEKKYNFSKEIQ